MYIHGLGTSLACRCRPDATRVTPSQILCAAEVCAPLSTPTWDVSVQPHGVIGNNNPSGVNLQEPLGWHRVVIGHEWISDCHRCGREASRFPTTALRRVPTGHGR